MSLLALLPPCTEGAMQPPCALFVTTGIANATKQEHCPKLVALLEAGRPTISVVSMLKDKVVSYISYAG